MKAQLLLRGANCTSLRTKAFKWEQVFLLTYITCERKFPTIEQTRVSNSQCKYWYLNAVSISLFKGMESSMGGGVRFGTTGNKTYHLATIHTSQTTEKSGQNRVWKLVKFLKNLRVEWNIGSRTEVTQWVSCQIPEYGPGHGWWSSSASAWQNPSRSPSSPLRRSTSTKPSWTPSSWTDTCHHMTATRPGGREAIARCHHCGHGHKRVRVICHRARLARSRHRHDLRAPTQLEALPLDVGCDLESRSRRRGSNVQGRTGWHCIGQSCSRGEITWSVNTMYHNTLCYRMATVLEQKIKNCK